MCVCRVRLCGVLPSQGVVCYRLKLLLESQDQVCLVSAEYILGACWVMLNWRLYLFKFVLLYFRSKALFIYLQRFCLETTNSINKYKCYFNSCYFVIWGCGTRALSTTEQHLWLFILSQASLPSLTTVFDPPASVSWVCGIADVCATAPAYHSFFYHKLKWKNWIYLELVCC